MPHLLLNMCSCTDLLLSYRPTVLPSYSPTVLPSYRPTVLPSYRTIVLSYYRTTVLPYYRTTVLPYYRTTVLLYSDNVLLNYCIPVLLLVPTPDMFTGSFVLTWKKSCSPRFCIDEYLSVVTSACHCIKQIYYQIRKHKIF